jgi:signal transduction histidine kinase
MSRMAGWWLGGLAGLALVLLASETGFMFWSDKHLHDTTEAMESLTGSALRRILDIRSSLLELPNCFAANDVDNPLGCADGHLEAIDANVQELWRSPHDYGRLERLIGLESAMKTVHERRAVLHPELPASATAVTALLRSLAPAHDALDDLIRAYLHHLTERAASIRDERRRSELVEVLLTGVAVAVAFGTSVAGLRAMRRHNRFLQMKAEELEHFAGTVAHDVLGPLSAVGLTMPMIQERNPSDDQTQRLAERALGSVRRVRLLVYGLLEFARAGAQPTGGRAEIRATIADALSDLQREVDQASVSLETRIEEGNVACAPGVLLSIISNLVRNAVKYMGDPKVKLGERRVWVRARRIEERISFEIEDTGPGIPEALQDAVFEPYVRIARGVTPGLGLGLATVKRLVIAHGGAVGVRTTRKGGSLFWFELPAA